VSEDAVLGRGAGIAAVATVMVIFGTTFVAIKIALNDLGPLAMALARFLIALVIFAPFLRRGRQGMPAWQMAAMGFLGVTLFFSLQNWGLVYTTAANASIILSAIPALTAIIGWLALGEALNARRGAGILLSMAGVAVVVGGAAGDPLHDANVIGGLARNQTLLGDLMILGAALCWALYTVLGRHVVARLAPAVVTAHTAAWGVLFLAPFALAETMTRGGLSRGVAWPSPASWAALLFLAFVASGLAFYLYLFALTRLEAGEAAVYVNLSPVVTLIAADVVLAESITVLQLLGAVLVLAGVYLTERAGRAKLPASGIMGGQ
jgi:drug/metabolite transporter (DMT)-like permease